MHIIWRLSLPQRKGSLPLLIATLRNEAERRLLIAKVLFCFFFVFPVLLLMPFIFKDPDTDKKWFYIVASFFFVYLLLQFVRIALLFILHRLTSKMLVPEIARRFLRGSVLATIAFLWLFMAVVVPGKHGVISSLQQRHTRECHQYWWASIVTFNF